MLLVRKGLSRQAPGVSDEGRTSSWTYGSNTLFYTIKHIPGAFERKLLKASNPTEKSALHERDIERGKDSVS